MTRGALYHQFADKRDLFRGVFEQVDSELIKRVASRALAHADPLEALRQGFLVWLEECSRPEVQRIVLVDAPGVLGWEEWRATGERTGFGIAVAALEHAIEAGAVERQPVQALAHVVIGALDEAALYIARADDPAAARRDTEIVLERMIETMRPGAIPPRTPRRR